MTKTGNGPEAFALTPNTAVAGNDFEVLVESIAVDTNGNGVYDPGVDEILTAPQALEPLAADEAVTVGPCLHPLKYIQSVPESLWDKGFEELADTGLPAAAEF